MADSITIRPATLQDAESVAQLSAQTFREAFAKDSKAEDIDAYITDTFAIARIQTELSNSESWFLLAFSEKAQALIGYAKLRAGTIEPCVTGPLPVELERLYIIQAMIGEGVGAKLIQASLNRAKALGYKTIWLGVWEHNLRAIAFYKRWAFETVGSHPFHVGSDNQTDFVMARPLT